MIENNILDLTTRSATWESIGTDISQSKDISSVIANAGLDYTVEKQNVIVDGTGFVIPDKMATIRKSDNHCYGIVSSKYQIVQNSEAFDFVNYINDEIDFVKAGETKGGMVYIIGKLPDRYVIDDKFTPYVIFRNSFNGRYPVQSTICPLRIVCQNQFNVAFKESQNTITIRHSLNAEVKMKEAQEVLKSTAMYMDTLGEYAEKMAVQKLSEASVNTFIDGMFTIDEDMSARQKTNIEAERASFLTAYNAEDNQNYKNTKWGLINAFSDFQTHKPILRKTDSAEEQRFVSVVFDPTAMMMFAQRLNAVA